MTTVYVSQPGARINLFEVMSAWLEQRGRGLPLRRRLPARGDRRGRRARVGGRRWPRPRTRRPRWRCASSATTSTPVTKVQNVAADTPADGGLKVGDVLLAGRRHPDHGRRGRRHRGPRLDAGQAAEVQDRARDGKPLDVSITPRSDDGVTRVGHRPGPGFDLPVRRARQHRPRHRRAQRRADVLPRRSTTPSRPARSPATRSWPAPGPSATTAASARSAASSRRSSRPATTAPSSSWCPPDNCADALGAPNERHAAGPRRHHARRGGGHRDLGRGPRRRPPAVHARPPTRAAGATR